MSKETGSTQAKANSLAKSVLFAGHKCKIRGIIFNIVTICRDTVEKKIVLIDELLIELKNNSPLGSASWSTYLTA
jgi:hypothetical protein